MSFRADLTVKDGVHIFLVVVRNQININFQLSDIPSKEETPYHIRENFNHLLQHFHLNKEANLVRGEDPEHIKRHHIIAEEARIPHTHVGFSEDVTPEMLEEFFKGILRAQKDHTGEDEYQFLDKETIQHILMAYREFYTDFVDSNIQKQFLEERKLTQSEKQSLVRHSQSFFAGTLTSSDKKELKECGIRLPNQSAPENLTLLSLSLLPNMLMQLLASQNDEADVDLENKDNELNIRGSFL
ncbi:hypothetical protein E3983_08855 [Legionella israelensis]|uniref:Uncharacterized protein n=1 Tax=Legionella israelensis TaxID=454 RepID=A0AAX1EHC1_9GAMM|nr:hypothetical protein [Legionella israelensis]QBR84458.1 hypothetical protein E3983_08855 [Legionella israelensis]